MEDDILRDTPLVGADEKKFPGTNAYTIKRLEAN